MINKERTEELREKLRPVVREHANYKQWLNKYKNALGIKADGEQQKIVNERSMTVEYRNWLNYKIQDVNERLHETEKSIRHLVKELSVWTEHYCNVKGIGEITIGYLEAYVDLDKALNEGLVVISKVWRFCGYGDSRDHNLKRGEGKRKYCAPLCSQLYTTGMSLEKSRNTLGHKYGKIYDDTKNRLENSEVIVEERKPKKQGGGTHEVMWKDGKPCHRRDAAIRRAIKEVLKDYTIIRAELEGREVRPPYSEEYLGRKHSE